MAKYRVTFEMSLEIEDEDLYLWDANTPGEAVREIEKVGPHSAYLLGMEHVSTKAVYLDPKPYKVYSAYGTAIADKFQRSSWYLEGEYETQAAADSASWNLNREFENDTDPNEIGHWSWVVLGRGR